jgi:EmrB/QacA subfamily drug resistance transporter
MSVYNTKHYLCNFNLTMTGDNTDHKQIKSSILFVAVISAFLTPFMGSAINLALPSIGKEFNSDAILLGWIATAYLLSSAVFLLPFGRLADIYGRKKVFLAGMIIFTLSSLVSSIAPNITILLAFRIFQGMGSSMIFATGIAIVTSVFPPEERGKAIGMTIASVYTGLSVGPFAGGILTEYLGWRSIFLFTVLLGIISIYFLLRKVKGEWAESAGEPFDLKGSLIYGSSLCMLIIGLSRIPSAVGLILLVSGATGIIFFILHELRTPFPVMQLGLFRNNTIFAWSNVAALINYSATFAVGFILSLFLQYIRDYSARDAGLILLSQPVIMALVSPLAGRWSDRIEPRLLATAGMTITSAGLFLLIYVNNMSVPLLVSTLILLGAGFGLFSSPNSNAIMSSVSRKYYGIASGTMGTMRLLGQMFSMGMVMVIMSFFIGRVPVTLQNSPDFLLSIRVAFFLFFGLCLFGIYASYARGNMHIDKSQL